MIRWYAVLVELDNTQTYDGKQIYGTDITGALRRVDGWRDGVAYSVAFRCGEKLLDMAENVAAKYDTTPVSAVSDTYMDNHDIPFLDCIQASASTHSNC